MTSKVVAWSIVGLLFVTSTARGSQGSAAPLVVLFSSQDEAGVVTEFRVTEARLASTKTWSPESAPPPISIASAVAIAKKHLKPQRPADMILTGIELIKVSSGASFRWFYQVRAYDSTKTRGQPPPILDAVVLMDGSVVEPVRK